MSKDFCSLHTHTSYSALDGASKIKELVKRAKELGMSSLGISDHGVLSGIPEFYRECKANDIRPVLGSEIYFANDRLAKEGVKAKGAGDLDGSDKRYMHLSVYAATTEGYHNLVKISSDAYLNGFHYKPRSDYATISAHKSGLIVGSGCLGGPVLQPLLHGDYDGALTAAANLRDSVDEGHFFIELMDHGLQEQKTTNPQLLQIAKTLGLKAYVSQDSHYTHKCDSAGHDALLCLNTGAKIADSKRFRFHNDEYYLKSPDEMYHLFRDYPELCDNTLHIAEMCDAKLDFETMHLPIFLYPDGFKSDHDYLRHLVWENASKRYPVMTEEISQRINYELNVYETMNVSSYMLIVWDLTNHAREQGFFMSAGRGSAAGSIVSYILGVTQVDPIKYGLIFERFLNPSRIALPDVDMDFPQASREHMINYTIAKYGEDYVSYIGTFGTVKARSAIRDAARVLDHAPSVGDRISKMIPPLVSGFDTSLKECFELNPSNQAGYDAAADLRQSYVIDEVTKEVVDVATQLEGLLRSYGIHAAAVIIGDRPLVELLPLLKNKDGLIVSQYDKDTVEDLGLVKMDFLGLKNLDILGYAQDLVGGEFKVSEQSLDDPKTYAMLSEGHSLGCFQVDSSGLQALLRRMRPNGIEDLSAALALYRPGPMAQDWHNMYADRKNGRQVVEYFHPDAVDILSETQGIPFYQEDLLLLARKFAGYNMAEADMLRKIIGKKKPEAMRAERSKFVKGCLDTGYEEAFADDLFDKIEGFSAYGFAKAHSMSYAFVTYWTAFMKANYPREYMASLLTYSMDDLDKVALYVGEARRMGLKVYPPDLSSPTSRFTVEPDGIRVGMGALKGVGEKALQKIIDEGAVKPFTSLEDFVRRTNPNVTTLKALASAGALEKWGTRQGISVVAENLLESIRKESKRVGNMESLFGDVEVAAFNIPDFEYGFSEILALEKQYLGIYISGHPLDEHEPLAHQAHSLNEMPEGSVERILAVISSVDVKRTKSGALMASLVVEDQTGALDIICFPKAWSDYSNNLNVGDVVHLTLKANWDSFREARNYILLNVDPVETERYNEGGLNAFSVYIPRGFKSNPRHVGRMKGIFLEHKGRLPVEVWISRSTRVEMKDDFFVDGSEELKEKIRALFKDFKENK